MDLTEAFAPGGGGEDLAKTDFFDFVVSPPPHCTSADGISDEESFLQRTTCRNIGYLQDSRTHEDVREMHGSQFIKETNNNTLTALPPVSTITGSLNHHHHHHHHHHHVRNHCGVEQSADQVPMDQSDCDYWGTDDGKEQACNILLEDLNKYCWSAHTNVQTHNSPDGVVHQANDGSARGCTSNDRQNTDGAIYTLTVLNNEANSMDALDCCKSPTPASSDSWTLRPNLDLDAILNLEPTSEQDHDQAVTESSRNADRYHADRFSVQTSQYSTDDSGFVESKELCVRGQSAGNGGDNNNDWKLSDQNHLQEAVAVAAAADTAESLLRSALQGKLYSGPTQTVSTTQGTSLSLSITNTNNGGFSDQQKVNQQQPQQQQQQQTQSQQDESMHGCTDEELLLSQLDPTTYRPGEYEKIKSIANEVVESYCNLEPVCNVSATTTVMYTLDPASGSLGTITLPADLGQVSTVTVVTAAQQDVLQQNASRGDVEQQQQTSANQMQIATVATSRVGNSSAKSTKKYCRRANRTGNHSANSNVNNSTSAGGGGTTTTQQQGTNSPGSVQRKERSLHYCNICSKGFKDKYSVNVHIRTHTGEKPFACSLCGKSFRQKAHLAKHYQTHVAQKPNVQSTTANVNSNTNSNVNAANNNNNSNNSNSSAVAATGGGGGGGGAGGGTGGNSSSNSASPSADNSRSQTLVNSDSTTTTPTTTTTTLTCNPSS